METSSKQIKSIETYYKNQREEYLRQRYSIITDSSILERSIQRSLPIPIPKSPSSVTSDPFEQTITFVSVTIIYDGKVLVGKRGISDTDFGKLSSIVGMTDTSEKPEQTVVRKVYEKAGIEISPVEVNFLFKRSDTNYYYVVLTEEPVVRGPNIIFQREFVQSTSLEKIFDCTMILNSNSTNTGLTWIPIKTLVESTDMFVIRSPVYQILTQLRERQIL